MWESRGVWEIQGLRYTVGCLQQKRWTLLHRQGYPLLQTCRREQPRTEAGTLRTGACRHYLGLISWRKMNGCGHSPILDGKAPEKIISILPIQDQMAHLGRSKIRFVLEKRRFTSRKE